MAQNTSCGFRFLFVVLLSLFFSGSGFCATLKIFCFISFLGFAPYAPALARTPAKLFRIFYLFYLIIYVYFNLLNRKKTAQKWVLLRVCVSFITCMVSFITCLCEFCYVYRWDLLRVCLFLKVRFITCFFWHFFTVRFITCFSSKCEIYYVFFL